MDTQKILLGVRLNEDGKHTVRRVRDLTETDSLRLTDALEIAAQFSQNYGLYEICRANHQAIVRLNDQINEVRGLGQDSGRYYATEMNRGFLNLLCSFRAYIDHSERKLKKWRDEEKDWFEMFHERTSIHFDSNFWYRFFWKLRHYIQHRGLPVAGIEKRLVEVDGGRLGMQTLVYFNRDELLSDYDDWGTVREDLLRQPDKIDVMTGAQELISSIDDLSQLVAEIIIDRLGEGFLFLHGLMNEVIEDDPDARPFTGHVRVKHDGSIEYTSFESLPLRTMNDIGELRQRTSFTNEG